jgi:hypothetical protein
MSKNNDEMHGGGGGGGQQYGRRDVILEMDMDYGMEMMIIGEVHV